MKYWVLATSLALSMTATTAMANEYTDANSFVSLDGCKIVDEKTGLDYTKPADQQGAKYRASVPAVASASEPVGQSVTAAPITVGEEPAVVTTRTAAPVAGGYDANADVWVPNKSSYWNKKGY